MKKFPIDIDLLRALIQDVQDIFFSEKLLSCKISKKRFKFSPNNSIYRYAAITPPDLYFSSIDSRNQDTPYLDMIKNVYDKCNLYCTTLNQDLSCKSDFEQTISEYTSGFGKKIESNASFISFVNKLRPYNTIDDKNKIDELISDNNDGVYCHVLNTLVTFFNLIIQVRSTTMSTRYDTTEVFLEAINLGLFPYGIQREKERILCLNPCDL